MKSLYLASFLTVGLSISAFAIQSVPLNTKGGEPDPRYAGASACEITNSTGTTAVLCTAGSGVILQVIGSSVATTDYLTFRDSATANTSSTELMRISQANIVGSMVYPRFKNGLSVNASVAPTAATGAWTVIYNADLK